MKIQAAVTRTKGAPFVIEDVDLGEPRHGEIVMRMVATGICHSDISAREQYLPLPLPMVFGHEGAGIVEAVGTGVTTLKPGDPVILSRHTCGDCAACKSGKSNLCQQQETLNLLGSRVDGTTGLTQGADLIHGQFFGQSSFATYALAHERNATKVGADFDLTLGPAFSCGVLTGAGAVINGIRPSIGSAAAVFGCGTVGLAAVLAAWESGCGTIIAVDRLQDRLDLALDFGATHSVLAGVDSTVAAVRSIAPLGVDFAIEATGVPAVARAAVESLAKGGECALLGVGPADQELTLNHMHLAFTGAAVRGFPTGMSEPDITIPQLIALYRAGRFPIDRLVTKYPFAQIEQATQDAIGGHAIKPILIFE